VETTSSLPDEGKWKRVYIWVCIALLPPVVFFAFNRAYSLAADFWLTAAVVQELAGHLLHPENPVLSLPGDTSPRFTPFTVLWGAFMKATGLDLSTVMGTCGLVNFLLLVSGIYRFVRLQFRRERLPVYVLLTMLWVWGTGYHRSNEYYLDFLLMVLPYRGTFAFALCFHALASLRRYCDETRWNQLALYTALSVIVFITHPITPLFGFASALAMLLADGDIRRALLLQAIPAVAFGAALVWPYFDFWNLLALGTTEHWFQTPLFSGRTRVMGMSVIGFPIVAYYALRRKHLFLLYGLFLCLFVYAWSDFHRILIGGRFLYFTMVFLHLAIAVYLDERGLAQPTTIRKSLRGNGLAVMLLFILVAIPGTYRATGLLTRLGQALNPPAESFFFLADHLETSDIVMATPEDGWVIPALTGARVVAPAKGNPLIQDQIEERRADVERFYAGGISVEEGRELLRRYRATHILSSREREEASDPALLDTIKALGTLGAQRGGITLYRVSEQVQNRSALQGKRR
jgi:hypothetical protein